MITHISSLSALVCSQFCIVALDLDGSRHKVAFKDLHALQPTPNVKWVPPSDKVYVIKAGDDLVAQVKAFLRTFQTHSMVDLVLKKVNNTCSHAELERVLQIAQKLASDRQVDVDVETSRTLMTCAPSIDVDS
jgi:hypothetical protein